MNYKFKLEDILKVLQELADSRPVFFNESDFQFSLSQQLNNYLRENKLFAYQIILEYKHYLDIELIDPKEKELINISEKRRQYIDIIILDKENNKYYPIELKYKTIPIPGNIKLKYHDMSVAFNLSKQGAQNLGCAYYLQDIQRLTDLKRQEATLFENYEFGIGFAIFVTNDKTYWKNNTKGAFENLWLKNGTISKEVFFTKDTKITKQLYKRYKPTVKLKSIDVFHTTPIFEFEKDIKIKWSNYSLEGTTYSFSQLIVEI
jgi:hypothetical protein